MDVREDGADESVVVLSRAHPRRLCAAAGRILSEGHLGSEHQVLQGGVQVPSGRLLVARGVERVCARTPADCGYWGIIVLLTPRVDSTDDCRDI